MSACVDDIHYYFPYQLIHNPGRDTVEETPLAHACARGFLGIVELLVSKGAKLNYRCSVQC